MITTESLILTENVLIKKYDDVQGIFYGTLVKYGNRDKQGDIILNDACIKSATEWKNGRNIPAFYEHNPNIVISNNMGGVYNYHSGLEIEMRASDDFKKNYPNEFETMISAYNNGTAYFSVGISPSKSVYQKIQARDESGIYTRYIFSEVYITEGSFTTTPANMQARVDFVKSMQEFDEILKSVSCFSRAEEFLRKNSNLSKTQCGDFLKKYESVVIEKSKNLNLEGGCQTKDFVGSQNNNASFWGEVDILLTKK